VELLSEEEVNDIKNTNENKITIYTDGTVEKRMS